MTEKGHRYSVLPQEVVSSPSLDVLTLRWLYNEKEIQPRQGWEAELPILRGWSPSIPSLWLMTPSLFKESKSPLEKLKGWHLHKVVPTLLILGFQPRKPPSHH